LNFTQPQYLHVVIPIPLAETINNLGRLQNKLLPE
jgi:hypothetical protein